MPMSESVKGALVGAVLTAVVTLGGSYLRYIYVDKPALDDARQKYADEQAARQRAEAGRNAERQKIDDIREQFTRARDENIGKLTITIREVGKLPPGWEPGKPGRLTPEVEKTLNSRAREIVNERERTREAILRSGEGLKEIYNMLDSDIDEIKKIIDNPPVNWQNLFAILQRLNAKWPTTLQLIDARIDVITLLLGCPRLFAQNP